ncbi:MAG TPA: hypothetical protein VME18_02280 [Acidobacteriaceae bacterium]|nr:hypothetical protein [Acidobacteriaceae bacterium]
MRSLLRMGMVCGLLAAFAGGSGVRAQQAAPPNRNFRVAVYIPVNIVERMANDPAWLRSSWQQINRGVRIDKVYIETYRSRNIAPDADIDAVKKFFGGQGVQVAGGIAYSDVDNGQFTSFCYTNPADRAYVKHVAELTARHFNEIILDDFFFNNTKEPSDIAAKGNESWSAFRLKQMDEVSRDLVTGPARAVNPKVKIIIKFPNWYPSFQENGYDLAVEPKIFSGIYTGTETRDPVITDQLLQQYESYEIIRYFDNVDPGRNGGGWVDTFSIRYIDRYPEQLWDTVLAKTPQIVLFEYTLLLRPAPAGNRAAWADLPTSFDYNNLFGDKMPDFAAVAGKALDEIDPVIGKLGKPLGVAVYRPLNSTGEDFLPVYLGELGLPVEMYPQFPASAKTVVLTEAAQHDPQIMEKIKAHLMAGGNVVITSGLLHAMQAPIAQICGLRDTGREMMPTEYWGAYGAGNGANMGSSPPLMMPEIHFFTNDAWPLIRGTANGGGAPILLMDRYGRGVLYALTVPDNFSDLYSLPVGVLNSLRHYLGADLPVQLEGPSQVSLMEYDNGTFVVESFRDAPVSIRVSVAGADRQIRNLVTNEMVTANAPTATTGFHHFAPRGPRRSSFELTILPHSYEAFAVEGMASGGR